MRLLVVDDDEVVRDVLMALGTEAGYTVTSLPSGDAAVSQLGRKQASAVPPDVVLADMRMQGIGGQALAERLRALCGKGTHLIAMSAAEVQSPGFDHFLRKPFTMADVQAVLGWEQPRPVSARSMPKELEGFLETEVYDSLCRAMPLREVKELYRLCLEDCGRRIATMRQANATDDEAAWIEQAHALCGSLGFVGAFGLGRLAASMERDGLSVETQESRSEALDGFVAASAQLRRMLDPQA